MDKTLIYLSPSATSGGGHYFPYLDSVKKAFSGRTMALCSKNLASSFQKKDYLPFFSTNRYSRLMEYIRAFFLCRSERRIFFIEWFAVPDLVYLWFSFLFFRKKEDLLGVVNRDGFSDQKVKYWIQRSLYFSLSRLPVKLFTDSLLVQQEFLSLGYKMTLLPIPHVRQVSSATRQNKAKIVWWPGGPREEKGWQFLRELDKALPSSFFQLKASLEAGLVGAKNLSSGLSEEEYSANLEEADLILLPYLLPFYQKRTSGPLIEALHAGKRVLATEGTWLAYELKQLGLDACIFHPERESIYEAIKRILIEASLPNLLKGAQKKVQAFHNQERFAASLKRELFQ